MWGTISFSFNGLTCEPRSHCDDGTLLRLFSLNFLSGLRHAHARTREPQLCASARIEVEVGVLGVSYGNGSPSVHFQED